MRTIKFRGKRVDNGEWVYGCLLFSFEGAHIVSDEYFKPSNDETPKLIEVHPETVGQFTGLHDKDGNEIYEGDVVLRPDYTRGILLGDKQPIKKQVMVYKNGFHGADFKGVEVIGNIHDNPELIKEDNP